jgi:hypothetical protein
VVPLEVVLTDVLGAMNWGFWFFGMVCFFGLIGLLVYTVFGEPVPIGQPYGESSVYDREDMPATAHMLASETLSTGDILDRCLTHRSQLQYYHRILCERSGVDPQSIGPLADLISEAIYDGRNQFMCIKRVDESAFHNKERQHA